MSIVQCGLNLFLLGLGWGQDVFSQGFYISGMHMKLCEIAGDTQLSYSPIVVAKSSQSHKAACVTILSVMGNWCDSIFLLPSVQFSSVSQLCLTLWDPTNHSMPGGPVHHQLLELTQSHVHWVGDAMQPSHPLSSPSAPAPNPSQYQGLFQWVNSSQEMAKVLEFQLQHQSFQWTPRTYLL